MNSFLDKPTTAYFTTGLPNLGLLLNSRSSLRCESDGYPKPQYIVKKYEGGTLKETFKDKDRIEFQSVKLDDEKFEYTCTPFNFLGQGPETAKAKVTVIGEYYSMVIYDKINDISFMNFTRKFCDKLIN